MSAPSLQPDAELHQMATLGRLGVSLAHEINSPIGSLLSNNEVLLQSLDRLKTLLTHPEPNSLKQAARVLETCRSLLEVDKIACRRIRSLIRGIKGFSRLDDEGPVLVDLNREIQDTVCLATCQFKGRIQTNLDLGDMPEVRAYPQMLNQVFLNLLINAAQAIESEGTITIHTRCEARTAHVSISDTGKGMTPWQRARIFETGFTTKPRGEGTGFGLSISREIVEGKHGGTLTFESEAGVGTTFHVRLPLTRQWGRSNEQ
jgi:two-component system NtrC family sensor kinase